MQRFNQAGSLGALLLSSALLGYVIYQAILWPAAGFPTQDIEVILAGAATLRIGHWLKFADAIALALLVVAMYARLRLAAPLLVQLAAIAGISSVVLFLASGMLGLHILDVATATYPVNEAEAVATVYLRTVTIALFDAAAAAAGVFGLLFSLGALLAQRLPQPLCWAGLAFGVLFTVNTMLSEDFILIAVVLAIIWSLWLAVVLWRETKVVAPSSAAMPKS